MRLLITALCALLISSCEQTRPCSQCKTCSDYIKKENATASVESRNGLLIYIMAEPIQKYEQLEILESNVIEESVENSKGKKKFGQVLKEIVKTSSNYLSMTQIVNQMVNTALQKHSNADAIIFIENLTKAKVVKFIQEESTED